MKFGPVRVDDAHGAVLAHTRRLGSGVIAKGTVLTDEHLAALREAGVTHVEVARLESGDVSENEAARELAGAAGGSGLELRGPFTGRANLVARVAGVVRIDAHRVRAANAVHEAVTLSTLAPWAPVDADELVATAKIITFAVERSVLDRAVGALTGGGAAAVSVAPFASRRVGLVLTRLPGTPDGVLEKAETVTRRRVRALGSRLDDVRVVVHEPLAVADALATLRELGCDPLLVLGASAVVDRGDVVPRAVEAAGGTVLRFGLPVDPGNLLLLGRWAEATVLGVPGCARSPRRSGFDTVLERMLAGVEIDPTAFPELGVGGLLREIPSRPRPRQEHGVGHPAGGSPPPVGALVLAAGRSRRMGSANKLTLPVDGTPMIRRVVERVLEAGLDPVVVVTGHERAVVEEIVEGVVEPMVHEIADEVEGRGRVVRVVHNPDHGRGMSTSLATGFAALADDHEVDGVLVCLGDMPLVSAATLRALVDAFAPDDGRPICVPVVDRKRGNPVLLSTRYLPEIRSLEGDVGARELLARHVHAVHEVPVDDAGVLLDVDTRDALEDLPSTSPPPRDGGGGEGTPERE